MSLLRQSSLPIYYCCKISTSYLSALGIDSNLFSLARSQYGVEPDLLLVWYYYPVRSGPESAKCYVDRYVQ